MTIKKVEFTYKKSHLRYDSARKVWTGYQIDVRAGKKRFRNTFKTRGDAEKFIDALRSQQAYSKAGVKSASRSNVLVSQFFQKRLAGLTNEKERIRATRIFRLFEDLFDYPIPVTGVRTAHIQNYINSRTGVKPITIDREVTILSSAFKSATTLFPSELENFEPPQMVRPRYKKGKRRRRVITTKEKDLIILSILSDRLPREKSVRTDSRETVAAMFELSWMLGLRFSEAKKLLKSDFKESDRSLRVVRWKTGDVDLLEFLPDRVIEILRSAKSSTDFVFEAFCSDHTFAAIVRDACRANGITYGRAELDGVTFHSTRHSFTTRMAQVTDIATTQAYTGHSSKEMVDYYSHASEASKRRAMEKMYGQADSEKLRNIFDRVRDGQMDFDAFSAALK